MSEKYQYATIDENMADILVVMTRDDILNSFYDYWHGKMVKKFPVDELEKMDLKEMCVRDWVVNNWAWRVE